MMKLKSVCLSVAAALSVALLGVSARADALITDFDNFTSDALYPSWSSATIVSGASSYGITATGYGSNYKYIGSPEITGAGYQDLELTVTLSGPPEADGHLGPIVGLIDGDGTHYNFAWYGQQLGQHVLTQNTESPTWVAAPGTTPGLDLNTLTHMHMQLDPGGFGTTGEYTIEWENLSLVNRVPEPASLALMVLAGGAGLVRLRKRR